MIRNREQLVGSLRLAGGEANEVELFVERAKQEPDSLTVTSTTHDLYKATTLMDDDTAGGAMTATLPAVGVNEGVPFTVKKIGSTANVTIDTTGTATIDGAATYVLTTQYQVVTVISDGANWWTV